jgi:hypothetical protein
MDRSLGRPGWFLVMVCALVGAVLGVAVGLFVDATQTGQAAAASGRKGGMALAGSPPSSHPPGPQVASSGDPTDADGSGGKRPARSVTRPDQGDSKAGKHADPGRDKAGNHGPGKPSKAKPGKAKNKQPDLAPSAASAG